MVHIRLKKMDGEDVSRDTDALTVRIDFSIRNAPHTYKKSFGKTIPEANRH